MQRNVAAKHGGRTIARIVMGEGYDAGPDFSECLDARARLAWKYVIGTAHRERESITLWQDNAGRPNLDVDLIDLSGRESLLLIMGVIGAVG